MRDLLRRVVKRGLDLAIVGATAPLALGIVGAVGAAIRLETPGSPIFKQTRVGQGGRSFTVYKLRTMVQGADKIGAGLYAEPGDARFTRVGTFARRWSLDEVPQLFNVLKGDMSVIGPRPMLRVTVDEYPDEYARILQAKPGLTGLAQVSGRNSLKRSERLGYDIEYAERRSLKLDLEILARTLGVVASGDGQRNDQRREDVES